MQVSPTEFADLYLIKTRYFPDNRGSLSKYFFSDFFQQFSFKVDDIYTTTSVKNTIRGMHHQAAPHGQAKLVNCLRGSFVDIAVDLRPNSKTFGKVFSHMLKDGANEAVLVPGGFSHGTFTLEDGAVMLSVCSGRYMPDTEGGISMLSLGLDLDFSKAILSKKDEVLPDLETVLAEVKRDFSH